ncbi:MAG TPA: hypothetical protein VK628_04805 [Flavitalea sp.]|nr:hypothetical protein [Flavitalea sp.]
MKKISCLAIFGLFLLVSCTKHLPILPKPPVEPLTKKEMLIKYGWKVDELWHNEGEVNTHYHRGVENTTNVPYDVLRFKFNADGTGTHINQFGQTLPYTWEFATEDMRNIKFVLNGYTQYNWSLVEITEAAITWTVPMEFDGNQMLESARMVPDTTLVK